MFKIDHYDFGEIVINGKRYTNDVIILPDRVISDWWREEGHNLKLVDIFDILDEDFEYLIIGTGYYGRMSVEDEVIKEFEKRGKRVFIYRTKEAVREYNNLVESGKKVAAALHLTC